MTMKILATAALGLSFAGAAFASDLNPVENQHIDLGAVTGDAYYTVQPDGFHVVATFGTSTPVRFQAILASGQALSVSSPRAAGEQAVTVSIRRENQRLIVTKTPVID